ncbi:hypothetical protein [Cellulomonas denverensis]|uniref:Uncharacterized protein n=1 Tax=Cellulomonas denverensis TaxID=264297 RepID=A0A7X6KTU1_9CELL|nr:hypothetical protein [Cellulomonas denverensis]NKY22186.1 hypothetical protein [Cellulomonas denverensis]GIG27149.1 hypothetical protein Cde04nite_33930 [Cellulomonas denverensis]
MSAATMSAIEAAVRAHIEDEAAGEVAIVTDWFLVAASVGVEQRQTDYTLAHSDASPHVMAGLVAYGADLYASSLDGDDE